jgi:hypothetical protein
MNIRQEIFLPKAWHGGYNWRLEVCFAGLLAWQRCRPILLNALLRLAERL